jgi:hypothetical protein
VVAYRSSPELLYGSVLSKLEASRRNRPRHTIERRLTANLSAMYQVAILVDQLWIRLVSIYVKVHKVAYSLCKVLLSCPLSTSHTRWSRLKTRRTVCLMPSCPQLCARNDKVSCDDRLSLYSYPVIPLVVSCVVASF